MGTTPVTIFTPEGGKPAPAVVIAHGFAGSQQLMLPFAVTLARNGYTAVTFDFPGHGRNPQPLLGGLADDDARNRTLIDSLGDIVAFARHLPNADGQVALLGHSMASDTVVRYAAAHPDIDATVAVSLFSPGDLSKPVRNLLVIDGALEPQMLIDDAYRVVGGGAAVQPRTTYGDFTAGTARRLSLSGGVEHIAVLYSAQSMREALDWLNTAFGRTGSGYIDARGPWLGILYLGLVALAWPLSKLLPQVSPIKTGAGPRWLRLLAIAIAPAILTPLILWRLPTDFLPILLGDYLAVHFAVYGLLTAAGLYLTGWRPPPIKLSTANLAIATLAVAAYSIFAIGLPVDRFITSFMPIPSRIPLILAMLIGTIPYFLADEYLTRGPQAPMLGYTLTKLLFLVSLILAVTLNLQRLFFLIIIVPVILIFFLVYGLFSTWTYRRTNSPIPGALANAFAFAWAIAVTFPVIGG